MQAMLRICAFVLLLTATAAQTFAAEPAFRITGFSPQGLAKSVNQLRATFSEAVVDFGDPRDRAAPLESDCPLKGNGRWLDEKNWSFEFDKRLPPAKQCTVQIRGDLTAKSGKRITGQRVFAFWTGGAAIYGIRPYGGNKAIADDQVFVLTLDTEADRKSIEAKAYFDIEGIANTVPVRILDDAEAKPILDQMTFYGSAKTKPKLLLRAPLRLPAGKRVHLVWSRDIATPNGLPTGDRKDRVFKYRVREPFSVSLTCRRLAGQRKCDPLGDIDVQFSNFVPAAQARQVMLQPAPPAKGAPLSGKIGTDGLTRRLSFKGPFSPNTVFKIVYPDTFADDNGEKPDRKTALPVKFETGDYPPLAKFSGRFGILELNAAPVLPVTVRNLEKTATAAALSTEAPPYTLVNKIDALMQSITGTSFRFGPDRGKDSARYREKIVTLMQILHGADDPKKRYKQSLIAQAGPFAEPEDIVLPKRTGHNEAEVVGIPFKKPGFYLVEMSSRNLAEAFLHDPREAKAKRPERMYVQTGALVTNMAVHLKRGRENTLVWVTRLDNAEPVADAAIYILNCNGLPVEGSRTNKDGVAMIAKDLRAAEQRHCGKDWGNPYSRGLFVFAEKAGDTGFVHSSWDRGIESWRFGITHRYDTQSIPFIGSMVADRGLYRAGETAHLKFFVRRHGPDGLAIPKKFGDWSAVEIRHQGSAERYRFKLDWDDQGIAEARWNIPRNVKLGAFDVTFLTGLDKKARSNLHIGSLKVQEYKVPLAQASIAAPKEKLIGAAAVPLTLTVRYLAGGGADGLPVRLRTQITEEYGGFRSKALADFRFNRGPYRTEPDRQELHKVQHTDLTLDSSGAANHTIKDIPKSDKALGVLAELEYRDPTGEIRTAARHMTVYPSHWNIGIKGPDSVGRDKKLSYRVALRDLNDKPIAGKTVRIRLSLSETVSHRKKLAGGLYGYEHETRRENLGTACEGTTDASGLFACEKTSPKSGNIIAEAEIDAPEGLTLKTHESSWVPGEDYWWFNVSTTDRIDVLADKKRYEPGDTAKLQVRMPFAKARALVTFEREGVLGYQLAELSGRDPVIAVPLKDQFAPNLFLGVLAVRGRVSDIKPTAMVDLGRPAYKAGLTEIEVGWRKHRLVVTLHPEKEVYQTREQAKVAIWVASADGRPLPAGAEVALAVVDEGLLQLSPNRSWNLLDHMMDMRNNEVETATAQMQVVGKRHFGQKAVPTGGGGGGPTVRELFDTLVFWKGRVKLDAEGKAEIAFPLNDSLTGFRIAAVASAGAEKFGTGFAKIRTAKDLMVFAGLPKFAREGDRIEIPYTFRNTTEKPMAVTAALAVDGLDEKFATKSFTLAPGASADAHWQATVPLDRAKLTYRLDSKNGDTLADRLVTVQKVAPAVPVRTLQGTMRQLTGPLSLDIRRPDGALPGRGGLKVTLSPSITGGLAGVRDYMARYPYGCFEQLLSRAVSLDDRAAWDTLMAELPAFLDHGGWVKYFPRMERGSDTLSAYLLRMANEKKWPLPAALQERILGGLGDYATGRRRSNDLFGNRYDTIRKLAAIETLSRYGNAKPAMLESLRLDPAALPTSALLDWFSILRRVAGIKDRSRLQAESERLLQNRIRIDGRMLRFTRGAGDDLWWFMTGRDSNAHRLMLALLEFNTWRDQLPKLMIGAVARQSHGHWGTTTANAWGTIAVNKFAQAFEAAPVSGVTKAVFGPETREEKWPQDGAKSPLKPVNLGWPEKPEATATLRHDGTGAPWATLQSLAALPFDKPFHSGFVVRKTVTPLRQKSDGGYHIGDLLRVRLTIESRAPATWVVVDDPVPPGAVVVGRGLGGESQSAQRGEKQSGNAWLAYREHAADALRSYYEYVPQGTWSFDYTVRLNAAGRFNLPETRVEAMYNPELFGVIPNAPVDILR